MSLLNALVLAASMTAPDTMVVPVPEVVVSATRTATRQVDVPASTSVVTGEELRRRGTRTLAEALQDVVGLDTGEGSDNGARLPNIGMWGLKEFDALLVTLDGVPVGGPFNPSLAQIPVEEIDRIEIVKGPQGTLYGVSAFAGMIQVFRRGAEAGGFVRAGGGSFSQGSGAFAWSRTLSGGTDLAIRGAYGRSDGWQDRTADQLFHGSVSLGRALGRGRVALDVNGMSDRQDWGTPMPFENGAPVPELTIDRNYAFGGAKIDHQIFGGNLRVSYPLSATMRLENTLALTSDAQHFVRSFPGEIVPDTLESEGLDVKPTETSFYEDARLVTLLQAGGTHELVTGAALTWGETRGPVKEYEFDQVLSQYPSIANVNSLTPVDERDFEDGRHFLGVYVHDTWTPHPQFSLAAGGRFDATSEELETEVDGPVLGPTKVKDKKETTGLSGDVSVLVRGLANEGPFLKAANFYGSLKHSFKPAAPNLSEAEDAEILDPEHTTSWEVGFKGRAVDGWSFNASYFDMDFKDMVVSILGPGGGPELTNAGEQRFKGAEFELGWTPAAVRGLGLTLGYAHHDARFVDFTFVTPDSQLRDVSGKQLELVPREMVSGRVSYRSEAGPGGFVAVRYQGERPLTRRNTFFADPFTEVDAGLSFSRAAWTLAVVGRNLGDSRHVVTESEIGDSQHYLAPPRRFSGELTLHF
jgi:iron complex outermembrane recepter protein